MEDLKSQKNVWNNIALEWNEFKTRPARHVSDFLKSSAKNFSSKNFGTTKSKTVPTHRGRGKDFVGNGKILDFGSGSGRHLMNIDNGKMYLVDFSEKMLKLAEEKSKKENINAEFFVSDLNKISFEDNYFDFAIVISSIHCLESFEEREKAVKELYRVLKPKSEALIGVWNKNSKRFKNSDKEKFVKWRDKGARYYYLFDEKEVHDLFKKVGFKIKKTLNTEMMINFIVEK